MDKRRMFDREFKVEIVKQVLSGSRSYRSVASEIGVHENTIYKWVTQFHDDPEQAFPGSGNMKPEEKSYIVQSGVYANWRKRYRY